MSKHQVEHTSLELCRTLAGTFGTLTDGVLCVEIFTTHQVFKQGLQGTPEVFHLLQGRESVCLRSSFNACCICSLEGLDQ